MRLTQRFALLFAAALVATPLLRADTTYSTLPQWNGVQAVAPFGSPNTTTYGQVFVAPDDPVLTSFTFELQGSAGTQVTFHPEVYAWDGSMATGAALYSGAANTVQGTGDFHAVTTDTGDTELLSGQDYVAYFTVTTDDQTSSTGLFDFGLVSGSAAGSEEFAFLNNSGDTALLTSEPWSMIPAEATYNLAYSASFAAAPASVTPEPGSLALFGTGLAGMCGVARRRVRA